MIQSYFRLLPYEQGTSFFFIPKGICVSSQDLSLVRETCKSLHHGATLKDLDLYSKNQDQKTVIVILFLIVVYSRCQVMHTILFKHVGLQLLCLLRAVIIRFSPFLFYVAPSLILVLLFLHSPPFLTPSLQRAIPSHSSLQ